MKKAAQVVYSVEINPMAQREFDLIPAQTWSDAVMRAMQEKIVGVHEPPKGNPVFGLPDHFFIPAGEQYSIFYTVAEKSKFLVVLGILRPHEYNIH